MKNIVFILLAILLICNIEAQTQLASPLVWQISNASAGVNNDGLYEIIWENNGVLSSNIESFIIFKFSSINSVTKKPQYTKIATLKNDKKNRYTFKPSDELDKVAFYAVEAVPVDTVKFKTSSDNLTRVPWVNAPSNIYLTTEFDSCKNTIMLRWNKFYGGSAPTDLYRIEMSMNNGVSKFPNFNGNPYTSDTFLVLPNKLIKDVKIVKDSLYGFRVYAKNTADNYEIISNADTITPRMVQASEFVNADGSKAIGLTQLELNFTVDEKNKLSKLVIYRSNNETSGYADYDTVDVTGSTTTFIDKNVNASHYYYYQATLLSSCNAPITEIRSNTASNIVLKDTVRGAYFDLKWNDYKKFAGSLQEYVVYMVRSEKSPSQLSSTTSLSYSYNLNDLKDKKPREKISFYVEAIEKNNPHDVNGRSVSNSVIWEQAGGGDPELPKFLLLGDGCSKAIATFQLPIEYATPEEWTLIIFDRWGTKVKTITDPNEGWDGSYDNGSIAPIGAYMYYYKYVLKNVVSEKKGSFVVLCP